MWDDGCDAHGMHVIQLFLVASCLCRSPPATTGVRVGRVPRAQRGSKGGVSSPAEDLRPVSEVEAGVNFRLAGGIRRQVVGSLLWGATGHWYQDKYWEGVVTPSLHPEVPCILNVCVTWTWQENQAIDGLDEGVRDRTIGDLVAKG